MKEAIEMAGMQAGDINYINAHGTGTPNNDQSESAAMKRLFGNDMPLMSSTKSFTGHTTSASGSIETVICLLAMRHRFCPINLNWHNADEECVIPMHEKTSDISLNHVLCNSFGFGGNDSSLLLSDINI
jgi:3-oxoacyl-(acyl-carrier-protein) synthase